MTGRFPVESCVETGTGRYLIVYRVKGSGVGSIYSSVRIEPPKDISLLNGEIVGPVE